VDFTPDPSWKEFYPGFLGAHASSVLTVSGLTEHARCVRRGSDPAVLSCSAIVLALTALGAGFIPAHRASQVDPMRALRYE